MNDNMQVEMIVLTHVWLFSYIAETKKTYSECKTIASKLGSVKELPNECFDYKDIVISLAKRPTKAQSDHATAFEGMGSSAAAAAKARAGGRESYAQIQRRYTNTRRFTKDN